MSLVSKPSGPSFALPTLQDNRGAPAGLVPAAVSETGWTASMKTPVARAVVKRPSAEFSFQLEQHQRAWSAMPSVGLDLEDLQRSLATAPLQDPARASAAALAATEHVHPVTTASLKAAHSVNADESHA